MIGSAGLGKKASLYTKTIVTSICREPASSAEPCCECRVLLRYCRRRTGPTTPRYRAASCIDYPSCFRLPLTSPQSDWSSPLLGAPFFLFFLFLFFFEFSCCCLLSWSLDSFDDLGSLSAFSSCLFGNFFGGGSPNRSLYSAVFSSSLFDRPANLLMMS